MIRNRFAGHTTLPLKHNGEIVYVDVGIADLVQELWKYGVVIEETCQGDDQFERYIVCLSDFRNTVRWVLRHQGETVISERFSHTTTYFAGTGPFGNWWYYGLKQKDPQ